MVKLAARPKRAPTAPIKTKKGRKPDTITANAGAGFSRDAKSELFLLAVTNMVSEDTFYERGKNRDKRFVDLIRQVALEDADWIARFVPYLRDTMNMRSASIVMAAELVHAKLTRPVGPSTIKNRDIISSAIKRADEPAEMLGYWMSEWGKNFPQPVKRGVADAAVRLYNERSLIKYDGGDKPIRFGDVIDLVHPEAKAPWQSSLFKYALDDRHKRVNMEVSGEHLDMIVANRVAMALEQEMFHGLFTSEFVEKAGLTWEQASSKYGKLDAKFWEAMIPNMGIFALVRNVRNFDEAGISEAAKDLVRAKFKDEETIRKSRMFPLRFMAAYTASKSMSFDRELEAAIDLATNNVPSLKGRTLIMVDLSGSMDAALSQKSDVKRLAVASIFGAALAIRAEDADLIGYSDTTAVVHVRKTDSVLRTVAELVTSVPHSGTQTWQSVRKHYDKHDRVIVITDEQADYGWQADSTGDANLYTFNVAGYRVGHAPSGKKGKYTFGGLTDAAFTAIELLEKGNDQVWPF